MAKHSLGKGESGSSILPMGSMNFDKDKFLEKLYATEDTDGGIDFVMETISNLLDGLDWQQFDEGMQELGGPRLFTKGDETCSPNFEVINSILRVANPRKMTPGVGLAIITMTFRNQDKYSEYNAYKESYCAFLKSIGKKKLAKDVMKRYKKY